MKIENEKCEMNCLEIERLLMANNSESNRAPMPANTESHPNNFDNRDGNFQLDVSKIGNFNL